MRAQHAQFNVDLSVDGSEPLGLSIRTVNNVTSSYHEVARVVGRGQAARQDVCVGDILVGINHVPLQPYLCHNEVVQIIVRASRAWHHMKLNLVRNHNCSEKDRASTGWVVDQPAGGEDPTVAGETCTATFGGTKFLFGGCSGPEPLNPNFITNWRHVVAVESMISVNDWFCALCKRACISETVANASVNLQEATARNKILARAFAALPDRFHPACRLVPNNLLERAHLLLCLRVVTKFVEDEGDVDEITQCSAVEELRDITHKQWASLEFKMCNAADWKLRHFTQTDHTTDVRESHKTECKFWCGGEGCYAGCSCGCKQQLQRQKEQQKQQEWLRQRATETEFTQVAGVCSASVAAHSAGNGQTTHDEDKPRRLSDAEDNIALMLALDESRAELSSSETGDETCVYSLDDDERTHKLRKYSSASEISLSDVPDSTTFALSAASSRFFASSSPCDSVVPSKSGNGEVTYYSPPQTDLQDQRALLCSPTGSSTQKDEHKHNARMRRNMRNDPPSRSSKQDSVRRVINFMRGKWQNASSTPLVIPPLSPM